MGREHTTREGGSKQRQGTNIVLNSRGAAREVAANIVCVQTDEMTETARHKYLARVTRVQQLAGARKQVPLPDRRPSWRRRRQRARLQLSGPANRAL